MHKSTTFETSKRLKETGFPQPEPEAGQWWWIEIGTDGTVPPALVQIIPDQIEKVRRVEIHTEGVSILSSFKSFYGHNPNGYYFAPDATEIIRQCQSAPGKYPILMQGPECWECYPCLEDCTRFEPVGQSLNPHEAASGLWFFYNG